MIANLRLFHLAKLLLEPAMTGRTIYPTHFESDEKVARSLQQPVGKLSALQASTNYPPASDVDQRQCECLGTVLGDPVVVSLFAGLRRHRLPIHSCILIGGAVMQAQQERARRFVITSLKSGATASPVVSGERSWKPRVHLLQHPEIQSHQSIVRPRPQGARPRATAQRRSSWREDQRGDPSCQLPGAAVLRRPVSVLWAPTGRPTRLLLRLAFGPWAWLRCGGNPKRYRKARIGSMSDVACRPRHASRPPSIQWRFDQRQRYR